MKRALVFVLTLCLLTFAACGQSDMAVKAGTTKPDPNNKNLDWGVMMEVADLSSTGCTLKVSQIGGNPTGEVLCGCDFWIERQNDGEWISLGNDFDWTAEGYTLTDQTQTFTLNWQHMYGSLLVGTYRIGKEILDSRAPGDYDLQDHYTEPFTIAP